MSRDAAKGGSYVDRVREDTRRYARELLDDNERLRLAVTRLQHEASDAGERLSRAEEELRRRTDAEAELQRRLSEVEEESRQFSSRYAEIEVENSNLANLYVASYRLHGTVRRREVIEVIQEVAANLIGTEEMAVHEVEDGRLSLVASVGIDPAPFRTVPFGSGLIGRAAQTGEVWALPAEAGPRRPEEAALTACIPLKLDDRVTGTLALFRLLPQKVNGFEDVDRELFELLATHAAVALYASGLHERFAVGSLAR